MCLISGSKTGFPILYVHFSGLATVEAGCARALDQDWRRKGTKCHPVRMSLGTWGKSTSNSLDTIFHGSEPPLRSKKKKKRSQKYPISSKKKLQKVIREK